MTERSKTIDELKAELDAAEAAKAEAIEVAWAAFDAAFAADALKGKADWTAVLVAYNAFREAFEKLKAAKAAYEAVKGGAS